jgi:hypothetical protein
MHAGHTTNLTSDVRSDAIKVSQIEMPKPLK